MKPADAASMPLDSIHKTQLEDLRQVVNYVEVLKETQPDNSVVESLDRYAGAAYERQKEIMEASHVVQT